MSKIEPSYELNEKQKKKDAEQAEDTSLDGKLTGPLLYCLLTSAIGAAFQFGWSTAIFNTPFNAIRDFYNTTYIGRNDAVLTASGFDVLWSITNALMPLGGMIGGLSSGFLADRFGRKWSLIGVNVLIIINAILKIVSKFAKSYEMIMAARFFVGLSLGLFSGILPMYLNECSPKNLRGLAGTMNQLFITIGVMVTNIFGLPEILGSDDLWPILVALCLIPCIAHIALLMSVESPKHLYINLNRVAEAEAALLVLRGNDTELVRNEMKALADEKHQLSLQKKVSWGDMFSKTTLARPLFVTVVIQMSQQLSGINAVIFYSSAIFESVGLEGSLPAIATIILGVVQVLMTIVCMFLVDRAGRRILLLIGNIGLCLSCLALALTRIFGEGVTWLNYLTIVCAVSYMVFFSIGPGAIPWLITSELFSSDARGKATSIAVLINWFSNFLVTITFPFIEGAINDYSFLVFAGLLAGFSVFIFIFVPETKKKSPDEIAEMFTKRRTFYGGN